MKDSSGRFDAYSRKARLTPGLLTVLPVAIAVVGLGVRDNPLVASLLAISVTFGLPVLLASTVRLRGRRSQDRLFAKWGGSPTNQMLSSTTSKGNQHRRAKWHAAIGELLGDPLPTPEDEAADQDEAWDRFDTATGQLRELTRDGEQFSLLAEENSNYGFERNLLAMRPIAIFISACSVVVVGLAGALHLRETITFDPVAIVVSLGLTLLALAGWIWIPHEERVKELGFRYAEQLLSSVDVLLKDKK